MVFSFQPGKKKDDFQWGPSRDSQSSIAGFPVEEKRGRKASVLIALDNPEISGMMIGALKQVGDFECFVAESAKKALSLFFEVKPEVSILSYSICSEEDGIETAREILLHSTRAEIIVLTDSKSNVSKQAEFVGIEMFIDKDIGCTKIAQAVRALLDLKRAMYVMVPK